MAPSGQMRQKKLRILNDKTMMQMPIPIERGGNWVSQLSTPAICCVVTQTGLAGQISHEIGVLALKNFGKIW
jgi:hypothetical protein